MLKKASKAKPDFLLAVFSLGLFDFLENRFIAAENSMDNVIAVDPGFAPAYFLKGIIRFNNTISKKDALANISKAIELDPKNISYRNTRAVFYVALKDNEKALMDVETIVKSICVHRNWYIKSSSSFNINDYFEIYTMINIYNDYKFLLDSESRNQLINFIINMFFGFNFFAQENIDNLQKSSNHPIIEILSGMYNEKKGNKVTALDLYWKSIYKAPDIYYGYLRKGIVNFKNGNYIETIKDMDKVISLNDTINEAYRWRGLAYYILENRFGALKDFDYYLKEDSTDIDILFRRANILTSNGLHMTALTDLNKVLFYDEKDLQAIHLKIRCLYNLEMCEELLRLAESLKPSEIEPSEKKMIGYSYFRTGKYKDALIILKEYSDANPNDIQCLTWCGSCYFSISDYKAAITDFSKCIEHTPADGVLFYLRGAAYLKIRDIPSACADFKKAETKGYKVPLNFKDYCPE